MATATVVPRSPSLPPEENDHHHLESETDPKVSNDAPSPPPKIQQENDTDEPAPPQPQEEQEEKYRWLVLDAGPLIKLTNASALWKRAQSFCTVPGVVEEIRDARARHFVQHELPFDVAIQTPRPECLAVMADFCRRTGDYDSLSRVDLQVLALTYQHELDECHGDVSHLRTQPPRMVSSSGGNGKSTTRSEEINTKNHDVPSTITKKNGGTQQKEQQEELPPQDEAEQHDDDETSNGDDDESHDPETTDALETNTTVQPSPLNLTKPTTAPSKPSCWAALLDPTCQPPTVQTTISSTTTNTHNNNNNNNHHQAPVPVGQDQFDDADEPEGANDEPVIKAHPDRSTMVEDSATTPKTNACESKTRSVQEELQLDFPSLSAAATVPYNEDDNDNQQDDNKSLNPDERKRQALQPISKSGKLYPSSVPVHTKRVVQSSTTSNNASPDTTTGSDSLAEATSHNNNSRPAPNPTQSRIIGGMSLAGQEDMVEDDDGQGWITSTSDIESLKASGSFHLVTNKKNKKQSTALQGPPISQRAACATTDFAMQNVLLQMNLELVSVHGLKIPRVKSWVRRCGACFKVYTNHDDYDGPSDQRLFCDKCGSDMIQRVACSVNAKTGQLRLHLKQNYQHNLRGTKFSLPKPGSGNRFQGDLLLRQDQLLTGTWGQKAKMSRGGKAKAASESLFGRDIASAVGCHVNSIRDQDVLQVGFGRQNPNAAKGRERRGKKKKSNTRACGLRRY